MAFSAKTLLQKHNLQATKTRCAILNTLYQTQSHLSAEAIHTMLPNIGISSIYRNLAQLTQNKVILKQQFQNSCTYELNIGSHHDHLICIKCNKIAEFTDDEIEEKQLNIAKKHKFKITSHTLNLYGICFTCQQL